jgi:hypothetical protein
VNVDYRPILAGIGIVSATMLAAGFITGTAIARALHLAHPEGHRL